MGQTIKKIKKWFWRKKNPDRSIPTTDSAWKAKWKDIAVRTVKTFVQVALSVIVTAIADPPDAWKPVFITAISSGICASMNYVIKQLERDTEDENIHV